MISYNNFENNEPIISVYHFEHIKQFLCGNLVCVSPMPRAPLKCNMSGTTYMNHTHLIVSHILLNKVPLKVQSNLY